MVEPLKLLTYDQGSRICWENCPYAALLFISCLGEISHSKLTLFLSSYTIEKGDFDSRLTENMVNSLLRTGDIYEVRGGFYSALPSYAIQRNMEEWVILGDTRIDHVLKKEAPVFQVTSHTRASEVAIERLLLTTDEEAKRIFHVTGTRTFQLAELVDLIPDAKSLSVPKVWPNYLPGSYSRWQRLNEGGRWESTESETDVLQGFCRGLITDGDGRIISARYFFRHKDGWSPITYEEASLWVFKLAALAAEPYSAQYLAGKRVLIMPIGLPYTAYVVLKYLGRKRVVRGDKCIVEGIDYNIAQTVCQRLDIRLGMEVAS